MHNDCTYKCSFYKHILHYRFLDCSIIVHSTSQGGANYNNTDNNVAAYVIHFYTVNGTPL